MRRRLMFLLVGLGIDRPYQRWVASLWSKNLHLVERPNLRWTTRERLDVVAARQTADGLYEVVHADGRTEHLSIVIFRKDIDEAGAA